MIRPEAKLNGCSIILCCCMGSSAIAARILPGRRIVPTREPVRNTAEAGRGAIEIERYSHNSRRTDQYRRWMAEMPAGVITRESFIFKSRAGSDTEFDRVFIAPLPVSYTHLRAH